ncbi:MAG: hypothetical protein KDD73_05260 [Anaerolineales bacterium]|nr:hypothetical protein [Anaerolineales bacterium]MCB9126716.1 molecular chaperone DnaJ [Ardenticatenales bacterium]MCB9171742.1 molecular chaperone DnaJ [Ardenticatenales bacterium]
MSSVSELHRFLAKWQRASQPVDVFGPLAAPQEEVLRRRYRELANAVHPDRYRRGSEAALATQAFQLLQGWHAWAQRQIKAGHYGSAVRFSIASARAIYHCAGEPIRGDLADLYHAEAANGGGALLKIVRRPSNNDLMEREAMILAHLYQRLEADPLRAHFPTLQESFLCRDAQGAQRRINVLSVEADCHALNAVTQRYPHGLHPADAAWMFNRLLAALAVTHQAGLVHGAVLLDHLLIRPEDHNGILIDWCYAVPIGEKIRAICPAHDADYPPEVLARRPATPATDLYMAARVMARLLGSADGSADALPRHLPAALTAFLRGCLLPSPSHRPNDAWALFDDFQTLLKKLYGPPSFRPFSI